MKTRVAILVKPGKFEIGEAELTCGDDQIMIKTAYCGLCNWELNHWHGNIGPYPQQVGHEWCGRVVEVGKNVSGLKVGDKVTALPYACTKGFADYIVSDADKCFHIREEVDLINAMGEPLKCIVTVLSGCQPKAGDYGVIVGCGPMGLWMTQGLRSNMLAALIAVDMDDDKLKMAKKLGATHTINIQKENATEVIARITNGNMADFVVEGTGRPEVMNDCCKYAGIRGKVLLMSSHERAAQQFDFREMIDKGLTIIGTHPPYSIDQLDDRRRAVNMINNGTFRIEGKGCARRVPVILQFWTHTEEFGRRKEEAERITEAYSQDVQILSLNMPGFDGTEYTWNNGFGGNGASAGLDERGLISDYESQLTEVLQCFPSPYDKRLTDVPVKEDGRYRLVHWWYFLFEMHWKFRGMTNALCDYYEYPDEVHLRAGSDGIFVRCSKQFSAYRHRPRK